MKSMWIAAVVLLAAGCMQKGPDGTYHVRTKMDRATKQDVKKKGGELKADAKKLGKEIEQKSAEAAAKTGAALERAGQKMKSDANKRH
jgi:hypothetical protein